jgi:hypothetical protein
VVNNIVVRRSWIERWVSEASDVVALMVKRNFRKPLRLHVTLFGGCRHFLIWQVSNPWSW